MFTINELKARAKRAMASYYYEDAIEVAEYIETLDITSLEMDALYRELIEFIDTAPVDVKHSVSVYKFNKRRKS